jgi:integrase
MRLGEIIRLRKGDFEKVDGVAVMDIKHSKTQAGIRKVPIHPSLNSLGLSKYVSSLKTDALLFPDTSAKAYSQEFGFIRPR